MAKSEMMGAATKATFPIGPGEMFARGFKGFGSGAVPLMLAGLATLSVAAVASLPAADLRDDGRNYAAVVVSLLGLVVGGTLAYPWYHYALSASRGKSIQVMEPFLDTKRFFAQAVASFWFWAGVLLGLQYLAGIPSIFILVLYAFHGYLIADGKVVGGMRALGTSVRMGQGRRIGLFGLATLFGLFTFMGALPMGYDFNQRAEAEAAAVAASIKYIDPGASPLWIALAVVGVAFAGSVTLVAGATLYQVLWDELGDDAFKDLPLPVKRQKKKKSSKKTAKRKR